MESTTQRISVDQEINQQAIAKALNRIDDIDRVSRLNLLEFNGVSTLEGEDVTSLVSEVCKLVNVSVTNNDFSACHRKFNNDRSKPAPILATFRSRTKRGEIYAARVKLRHAHSSHTIQDPTKVFITENLTEKNGKLLYEARQLKKQHKWKHLWTKNGKVWIRSKMDGPSVQINNEYDLQSIE